MNEAIAAPGFVDGLVLHETDEFVVRYGYKPGMEGKVEGQRTFLVPKTPESTRVLLDASANGYNAINAIQLGERETVAIRFNGSPKKLLEFLLSNGNAPGVLGSGVPSLRALEEVSSRVAAGEQLDTLYPNYYP